jgi:mannitol/fructose-specific phosphotransferase system IIA component
MPKVIFSENSKAGKAVVKEWTQKLIDSGMSKENAIDHITGRDRPGSTTKYQIF